VGNLVAVASVDESLLLQRPLPRRHAVHSTTLRRAPVVGA
jgi:hypothetical protein